MFNDDNAGNGGRNMFHADNGSENMVTDDNGGKICLMMAMLAMVAEICFMLAMPAKMFNAGDGGENL